MVERKIYSAWAYTENELDKAKINQSIYQELKEKYKIAYSQYQYNLEKERVEMINAEDFDIIVLGTPGYAHTTYSIIKNGPDLSKEDLALICDKGNLCFGYSVGSNNTIVVNTD